MDDSQPLRLEDLVEGGTELGVPIAEQELDLQSPILQLPGQVPCLLGHPGAGRLAGIANVSHPDHGHQDDGEIGGDAAEV